MHEETCISREPTRFSLRLGVAATLRSNPSLQKFQVLKKVGCGHRAFDLGDRFGGACREDLAAFGAAAGAHVDEMVGAGDHVEVVLDDDDGVADVRPAAGRCAGV